MMNSTPLFACSKCFSRHPFEELSREQQLCKDCCGTIAVAKCTYCRSEFQHDAKGSGSTGTCKKCEQNLKSYGKPTACEYCNIIAAFVGNKCQRCTSSEKKYGPPVNCNQCKQRCAFDKHDKHKSSESTGKLLCWLCVLSYKRALAKTKQGDEKKSLSKMFHIRKSTKHKETSSKSHHKKRHHRSSSEKTSKVPLEEGTNGPPNKIARNNPIPVEVKGEVDPHSSDHVVAMTSLKEQIVSLKKQISQKDAQLLSKDKMITELKAQHFTNETELRNKILTNDREHGDKIEFLNKRVANLLKEVASLSKNVKKNRTKGIVDALENGSNSGSGTNSPVLQ